MHSQAWRGVGFHNPPALLVKRLLHGFAHHINAANIQTHGLGCRHCRRREFGVNIVGDIGCCAASGQVGIVTQYHSRPFFGDVVGGEALFL